MPRCDHCDGQMKKEKCGNPNVYVCSRCGGKRKVGAKKGSRSY